MKLFYVEDREILLVQFFRELTEPERGVFLKAIELTAEGAPSEIHFSTDPKVVPLNPR